MGSNIYLTSRNRAMDEWKLRKELNEEFDYRAESAKDVTPEQNLVTHRANDK